MARAHWWGFVIATLLAMVTVGCAKSPSEPVPATVPQSIPVSQETSPVESPEATEPEPTASADDAEVEKARAAIAEIEGGWEQALFAFTQVPEGFVFSGPGDGTVFTMRDEGSEGDDFAAIRFVRGDDELLLLQGGWDVGAGIEGKPASASDFGGRKATLYRDVNYGWTGVEAVGDVVIERDPSTRGTLALFGVGLTQEELEATAAALQQLN